MKTKFNYIKILLVGFFAILAITSCTKDPNDWEVDNSYKRMFRPGGLVVGNITITSAVAKWASIPGAEKYIIEISKDSLLFENIIDTFETTENSYEISNLDRETAYSIRVKVVASGQTDSKYSFFYFKTRAEQIMEVVKPGDVLSETVVVRWLAGADVTHFIVTDLATSTSFQVEIPEQAKAAGTMLIDGLIPETSYMITLKLNQATRGYASFRTFPAVPHADRIIFLSATDTIQQLTFDTLTVNNVTLALPEGAIYEYATTLYLKDGLSVTFFGLPGSVKPILSFSLIDVSGSHPYIKFNNVEISGFAYVDGVQTTTKRDYLINQGTTSTVGTIEFADCVVRNYSRSVVRLKDNNGETKYLENLVVDRCIFFEHGSGTYPLFYYGATPTGAIDNIKITNSTFYGLQHALIDHRAAPSKRIVIENCTFNNVVGASRYFIDTQTNGPTVEFSITNCLIGKSFDVTARGIRSASPYVVTNSYTATDWVTASNALVGFNTYNGASTALFTDPVNGNFTIKDDFFVGKSTSGDPRWRIE